MPFPSTVYELDVVGVCGGQYVENTMHFHCLTSPSDQLMAAAHLVEGWIASMAAAWLACLPSDYTLEGYRGKYVGPGGGPTYQAYAPSGTVGTRGGVSITSGSGPVLLFPVYNSALPLRKNSTGKIFMPGVASGDVSKNVFVAGLQTALSALIVDFITPFTNTGDQFIYCVSSKSSSAYIVPTVGFVSQGVGTQKRRLRPVI